MLYALTHRAVSPTVQATLYTLHRTTTPGLSHRALAPGPFPSIGFPSPVGTLLAFRWSTCVSHRTVGVRDDGWWRVSVHLVSV